MPTTPSPGAEPSVQPVIAPVVEQDAGELLTLQRAAYASEARVYDDPHLPALVQTLDELVAELAGSTALKAVLGHRIVGAARARVVRAADGEAGGEADDEAGGGALHVGRLTVAPDQQGRGVGSALLSAVERAAPLGVRTACLFTGDRSAANLRLYERAGYVEQRREPLTGSTTGVVLVHLVKELHGR